MAEFHDRQYINTVIGYLMSSVQFIKFSMKLVSDTVTSKSPIHIRQDISAKGQWAFSV